MKEIIENQKINCQINKLSEITNAMRVAFVANFPVLSETFILNQIVGSIERGNTVDIYAIEDGAEVDTTKVHL